MIPLCLTLESSDLQALDLLAVPSATVVRLQRLLSCRYAEGQSKTNEMQKEQMLKDIRLTSKSTHKDETDDIEVPVWWPEAPPGTDLSLATRRGLQGEIHLRPSLCPSTHFGFHKLSVSVSKLQ